MQWSTATFYNSGGRTQFLSHFLLSQSVKYDNVQPPAHRFCNWSKNNLYSDFKLFVLLYSNRRVWLRTAIPVNFMKRLTATKKIKLRYLFYTTLYNKYFHHTCDAAGVVWKGVDISEHISSTLLITKNRSGCQSSRGQQQHHTINITLHL